MSSANNKRGLETKDGNSFTYIRQKAGGQEQTLEGLHYIYSCPRG